MANEVIISEYERPGIILQGWVAPVYGPPVTSQIIDIAVLSAAMNSDTRVIRLQAKDLSFWFTQGNASASAAANTDGSHFLATGEHIDLQVDATNTHIDTAVDA